MIVIVVNTYLIYAVVSVMKKQIFEIDICKEKVTEMKESITNC